jgi:hypothetical protein
MPREAPGYRGALTVVSGDARFAAGPGWKEDSVLTREEERTTMLSATARARRKATSNLASGQIVIVSARWVLILTALALSLWSPAPSDLNWLRLSLLVLLTLAVGNFYLHAQILMRRAVPEPVAYAASVADLIVITVLTAAFGGSDAPMFVFYYPALLAFALVFPLPQVVLFTAAVVWLYAMVSLGDPWRWLGLLDSTDSQVLVARLISLVAIAVIANYYARVESERREAYAGEPAVLAAERELGVASPA